MIEIDKNEQILRVVHRHWFVLLGDIFALVFFLALPVVLLVAMNIIPITKVLSFTGSTFAAGGFFFFSWTLIVWMFAWKMWTDYYLDVLIVTDKRIFNIDQQGFFHRESGSFRIDRIQNISVDQKGIIQTLLNFGTIHIETAGENEEFIAEYIGNPHLVKKFINELQDHAIERSQLVHFDGNEIVSAVKPSAPTTGDIERLTRNDSDGL